MEQRPKRTKRPVRRLSTVEALHARHDRRSHLRTLRQERLFVQVGADPANGQPRRTLKCDSADLSRGGLRLAVDEALPTGTPIELWIRLARTRRNYYLLGEVRWCVETAERFQVGIGVREAPATDFQTWRRLCFV